MSGFPIIDLVVGMIFIYFLLSIISSSAIEIILTALKARAALLEEWLLTIFDKPVTQPDGSKIPLGQAIMDHCSVTALSDKKKSTSYIDAKNFASALLEKVTYDKANPKSIAKDIDDFIAALNDTPILSVEFQRVLLMYAVEAKDTYKSISDKTVSEMELFRSKVENWYDSSMDRLTDVLKKRYSRPATFFVALVLSCALNADSISIAKYLYSNPEARTKLATQAYSAGKDSSLMAEVQALRAAAKDSTPKDSFSLAQIETRIVEKIGDINQARENLDDVMPLTWKPGELNAQGKLSGLLLFSKIAGLLATVLAIMMGAPFWFDILNKVSNLRGSGAKPALAAADDKRKD